MPALTEADECDILIAAALRFDGYSYAESVRLEIADFDRRVGPDVTNSDAPAEEKFAALFALQRFLFKWGGERLPTYSPEWKRFRELFLATAESVPPRSFAAEGYFDHWQARYAPRVSECIALVRRIHEETAYVSQTQDLDWVGRSVSLDVLQPLAHRAVECDHCFRPERQAEWGRVAVRPAAGADTVPKLPYVGKRYGDAAPRVLVMMLNPGGKPAAHKPQRSRLGADFRDAGISYPQYVEGLARLVPQWGFGAVVRWLKMIGLRPDEVCWLNVALCGVAGDDYFPELFATCFEKHTRRMIRAITPDVVLLCGKTKLKPFVKPIADLGPQVCLTSHYRPMYTNTGQKEIARVRDWLSDWRA
ncbi:MAG: hypothetical protein AAF288_01635 [Planctomycetota bacterium]